MSDEAVDEEASTADAVDAAPTKKKEKKKRDVSFYWYFAARIIAAVANIVTIKYLVDYLSRPEYGAFGYYKAILAAFIPIVTLSLPAAMMRMYFDLDKTDQAGKARLITTVFWLTVGGAVLLAGGAGLWFLGDPDVELLAYAGAVGTGLILLGYFNYVARVRNDFYLYTFNQVVERLGFLVLMVLASWWVDQTGAPSWLTDDRLLTTILAYAAGVWLVNLVNGTYYAAKGMLRWSERMLSRGEVKDLVKFSFPLSVTYFLGWMLNSSDAYLLEQLSNRIELADYIFAVGIASFVGLISQSALTDWPRFYYAQMRDDRDDRDDAINRRVRLFLWLHVGALVVIRLVSRFAYGLFGAEAYLDGIVYVDYLVLGNYFFLAGNIFASGIGYVKKTRLITLTWAIPGAVNLGLNIWLIPIWGAQAAAITTLVAFALFAAISWVVGARYYRFTDPLGIATVTAAACVVALVPLGDVVGG